LKRCRWCQREVPHDAARCPHPDCGRALGLEGGLGGSIPPPPPPPGTLPPPALPPAAPPVGAETDRSSAADLRDVLDGLRQQVRAGRRRSFWLVNGAVAAALLGVACWAAYYVASVFGYAELDPAIQLQRDPADAERLSLLYCPLSGGMVGFRRRDADRRTELLDRVVPAAVGKRHTFQWRVRGLEEGDPIEVTFRRGLSLVTRKLRVPQQRPGLPRGGATLTGQIVNAVNNEPVPEAEVRIAGTRWSAWSDGDGWFRLDGLRAGTVPVEVSAAGFIKEQFPWELPADGQSAIRVVLSPGMEAGQIRIVLTWGDEPLDLDAHLEGPLPGGERFHVYFHEKGDLKSREFVRLDVDDRNGQGPETMTILGVLPGVYRYFVHDYSNRDRPESNRLARSGAEVKVYHGGQTYRFRAGHQRKGNIWNVCTIEVNGDGAIVKETDTYAGTKVGALGLYAKRTMPNRQQWIGDYGGSATSEGAVAEGLAWLVRHQAPDGSWSHRCLGSRYPESRCERDAPCTGEGGVYEMAHTGLAVLALEAAGHYYFNGNTYSDPVRRGLDWMVEHQRSDGGLIGSKPPGRHDRFHRNYMYEHGIAAFALAEAAAVCTAMRQPQYERYRLAAEKAVRFIDEMQHTDGGWRYTDDLGRPSDTSVTGWQVLALKSAHEAEIAVSEECTENVRIFFNSRALGENGRTGYTSRSLSTEATTGVGMLARQFLLNEPDAPLVRDAAAYLADYAEQKWSEGSEAGSGNRDFYLWYNCTLAMFQAGGEPWQRWNRIIRDILISLQRHDGCARGSWDPTSRWGSQGGRIYTTALAVLTLEVYYRYASEDLATGVFALDAAALGADRTGPRRGPEVRKSVELNAQDPETIKRNRGRPPARSK